MSDLEDFIDNDVDYDGYLGESSGSDDDSMDDHDDVTFYADASQADLNRERFITGGQRRMHGEFRRIGLTSVEAIADHLDLMSRNHAARERSWRNLTRAAGTLAAELAESEYVSEAEIPTTSSEAER